MQSYDSLLAVVEIPKSDVTIRNLSSKALKLWSRTPLPWKQLSNLASNAKPEGAVHKNPWRRFRMPLFFSSQLLKQISKININGVWKFITIQVGGKFNEQGSKLPQMAFTKGYISLRNLKTRQMSQLQIKVLVSAFFFREFSMSSFP